MYVLCSKHDKVTERKSVDALNSGAFLEQFRSYAIAVQGEYCGT